MSEQENRAIVRAMFDASNAANVEEAIKYTATDCLLNGEPFGREGDRMRTTAMVAGFPDGKWILDDAVAEGEKVVPRYTFRGTHQRELLGIPATGKQVTMTGITIYRIVNGQFAEIWESYESSVCSSNSGCSLQRDRRHCQGNRRFTLSLVFLSHVQPHGFERECLERSLIDSVAFVHVDGTNRLAV